MVADNCYIYQHTKLNGEIFYIGIGTRKDRAYSKNNRNKYWKNIVNKYRYNIEIIYNNLPREKACEIEIQLIKFYGRKDLGLGNLVNMTDGGDIGNNYICKQETRLKISNSKKGSVSPRKGAKLTKEHIEILSNKLKGKVISKTRKVLDKKTGIIYESVANAAKLNNLLYNTLSRYLNGRRKNKTNLIYLENE